MDLRQVVKISKSLADENRYRIFKTISDEREIVCKEITDRFPLKQPTISHHLKVLLESGLIMVRREGQHGYFSVNHSVLNEYVASFGELVKQ